jgi:hypothetical protein
VLEPVVGLPGVVLDDPEPSRPCAGSLGGSLPGGVFVAAELPEPEPDPEPPVAFDCVAAPLWLPFVDVPSCWLLTTESLPSAKPIVP